MKNKHWLSSSDHLNYNFLVGQRWPCVCPHPRCESQLANSKEMQFHFIDEHGFSRTRLKQLDYLATSSPNLSNSSRSKRTLDNDPRTVLDVSRRSSILQLDEEEAMYFVICLTLTPYEANRSGQALVLHDVASPSPPVTEELTLPDREGEQYCKSQFHLDRMPSVEPLSLDGVDSTLPNSPPRDDRIYDQFLRSPFPETESLLRDHDTEEARQQHTMGLTWVSLQMAPIQTTGFARIKDSVCCPPRSASVSELTPLKATAATKTVPTLSCKRKPQPWKRRCQPKTKSSKQSGTKKTPK